VIHDHGEDDLVDDGEPITETYVYSGDSIELTTVGIDIGSSTSHLIFSRLKLRRLGRYLSSRYVVVSRETLYRSPILLTPYTVDYRINAERLQAFVNDAYAAAGLTPGEIDTGAVILTGEALKRSNAHAIADLFASESGKFVCASAGHNLEAVLAAHGSGAAALSRDPVRTLLNVDIGGGTSKLALVHKGEVLETAAINVGGRLVAMDQRGRVIRIEPAARAVADRLGLALRLGEPLSPEAQRRLACALTDCLVETIGRGPLSPLTSELLLTAPLTRTDALDGITFSGGVSEYLYQRESRDFGDLALPLAEQLRSRLTTGGLSAPVVDAGERIRATVVGASQFTVQVSGNTINISRPDMLPLHNLQVLYPQVRKGDDVQASDVAAAICGSFRRFDMEEGAQPVALAIDWQGTPSYAVLRQLADGIAGGLKRSIASGLPIVLVFQNDFGKLVGYILRDDLGLENDLISIDSIDVKEFDYIDIGAVIHPSRAVPVVIKSLVFPHDHDLRAQLIEQ
jgi:ethanolamine utilization protein EutA (predicted chaperonin)